MLYFDGWCPDCQIHESSTDMLLNNGDLWECPKCHLQIATMNPIATILTNRGNGEFRESQICATNQIYGTVLHYPSKKQFFSKRLIKDEKALAKFLSEKVEPRRETAKG